MFRAKQKARRLGRFTNLSHALIAQRGKNSSCGYRSLGCPQLTSSSFDISVHFRVARQRYFKCECKCYALSCFIQKCVSLFNRLFTVKTLLFPKICTFVHQGIPTTNWFCPHRSMLLIDQIKDWFQLRTSIRRWTREWIKTEMMQNAFYVCL